MRRAGRSGRDHQDDVFAQKEALQAGKKSTVSDERYFRLAENYLYSELGFALNKDKDEVCRLIIDTVKKHN